VSPFRSALLECAASNHLPVHYASISYAAPVNERPADQSVCWWGEMTFPGHVFRLLQLSGFKASLVFGPAPIAADDRRVLASRLWSAVSSQFTPVVVTEPRAVATGAEQSFGTDLENRVTTLCALDAEIRFATAPGSVTTCFHPSPPIQGSESQY
jgi:hypothetical protein